MENICTSQWAWGSEGFMYSFLKQSRRYSVSSSRPLVLGRSHCALAAVTWIHTLIELLPWPTVYMDMISYSVLFACCTAPTLLIRLVWHVKVMNRSRICLLQVAVLSDAFEQLSEDGYLPSAVVAVVMLLVVLKEFALKRKVSWEERFSLERTQVYISTHLHHRGRSVQEELRHVWLHGLWNFGLFWSDQSVYVEHVEYSSCSWTFSTMQTHFGIDSKKTEEKKKTKRFVYCYLFTLTSVQVTAGEFRYMDFPSNFASLSSPLSVWDLYFQCAFSPPTSLTAGPPAFFLFLYTQTHTGPMAMWHWHSAVEYLMWGWVMDPDGCCLKVCVSECVHCMWAAVEIALYSNSTQPKDGSNTRGRRE